MKKLIKDEKEHLLQYKMTNIHIYSFNEKKIEKSNGKISAGNSIAGQHKRECL